jgi:hypothetical protein
MITGDADFWIPSVETDENTPGTNLSVLPMIIRARYQCVGCQMAANLKKELCPGLTGRELEADRVSDTAW